MNVLVASSLSGKAWIIHLSMKATRNLWFLPFARHCFRYWEYETTVSQGPTVVYFTSEKEEKAPRYVLRIPGVCSALHNNDLGYSWQVWKQLLPDGIVRKKRWHLSRAKWLSGREKKHQAQCPGRGVPDRLEEPQGTLGWEGELGRVSGIGSQRVEWQDPGLAVELCPEGGKCGAAYGHMNCWFRPRFPARAQRCVCEPRAAFVGGLWPAGHFQLNWTQGVTPSSVSVQLKRLLVAGWGTAGKGDSLPRQLCPWNCLLSRWVSLAADPCVGGSPWQQILARSASHQV